MIPNLLDPVPVWIRKADKEFTAKWDENSGEPYGEVRRQQKPIRIIAQIGKGDADRPMATAGGVSEESIGYLLVRITDLKRIRLELERGDMVVQIGEGEGQRNVLYFITKLQWRGHKRGAGGPTLLKAHYSDRQPGQQDED